jgi:tetratricopeptide (TPR) repeat protein
MHTRLSFLQHKNPTSEMIKNLSGDSLSAALAHVRKLGDDGADVYIEESAFNRIGYQLLNQERIADAIAVLKLNVDVFPQSANVYDSYAEALMKNGDIENAISSYKQSLALDPENDNAREMLRTLENQ